MFYLGGVGLSFFLSLLLLSKSKKSIADKILAGWLFIIGVHLLLFSFRQMQIYFELLGYDIPLPLTHGPFLFLYTLALTGGKASVKTALLHFAIPISIFIYTIHFLILPVEQKMFIYQNNGVGYEAFNMIRSILNIASGIVYVLMSSSVLRKHRHSIVKHFSFTERINLQWLQYLIYWIGMIWVFVILGNDNLIFSAVVLFILFIGFFGIRQVKIFDTTITIESEGNSEEEPNSQVSSELDKPKYLKSGLTPDISEGIHHRLSAIMANEKIFRESELSLAELAKRVSTQPNYLSQVINEKEGKNFYDYINTLRIDEFIQLVGRPEARKYTLLALAQECGFYSKSSFNRYFKKVTGKSPSEFMQAAKFSHD